MLSGLSVGRRSALLSAIGGNLGADLPQRKLVCPFSLGFSPDGFKLSGPRGHRLDVIFNIHDQHLRFAAAAHQEPLISLGGSF